MRSGVLIGVVTWSAIAVSVTGARAAVNFTRTGSDVTVGGSPTAVASADFNADGKLDLAVANRPAGTSDSGDLSVMSGNGDGTFAGGVSLPVGSGPVAIATGDFNNDGTPDIVVADQNDGRVSVLLNRGNMLFAAPVTADTGRIPAAIAVGDFNGDRNLDVATANSEEPGTVTILLGGGDGTLQPGSNVTVGTAPAALVAVDVDGDHNLDLVVANNSGGGVDANGSLTVLKGAGNGTFDAQTEITSSLFAGPAAIVSADFNGDGKADLAVANSGNTVVVLRGSGSPPFQVLTPALTVGQQPTGIVAADFDGDGKVDLATSNYIDDKVSVLLGLGDGNFTPQVVFSVAPLSPESTDAGPVALLAANINGDGKPDIATVNELDTAVAVLLNASTGLPVVCAGDCDASGQVTVDELIALVNIDLGSATASVCPHGIPTGAEVNITLIITAVNNALGTCPQPS
jgi:hypothetical protein